MWKRLKGQDAAAVRDYLPFTLLCDLRFPSPRKTRTKWATKLVPHQSTKTKQINAGRERSVRRETHHTIAYHFFIFYIYFFIFYLVFHFWTFCFSLQFTFFVCSLFYSLSFLFLFVCFCHLSIFRVRSEGSLAGENASFRGRKRKRKPDADALALPHHEASGISDGAYGGNAQQQGPHLTRTQKRAGCDREATKEGQHGSWVMTHYRYS